jgi:diguanylate cyclase (GGDEF)-like protein
MRPDIALVGQRFLEVIEVLRPRTIATMQDLMANTGIKLHMRLRSEPKTSLKGILVRAPMANGAIVNLSFGISILDGVRDYALTSADFAATDLTIEMLYLVEAKSAAMEASRQLNKRLQGAMIAAKEQAFTDTLTGLKNRRAMDFVLDQLIEQGAEFTLMHLDLDYFKAVNDTLGHAAGDHVLQVVARALVDETRDQDTVARIGGDEFVLVFNRMTDPVRLDHIAQRMIARLEVPTDFNGDTCRISASIGSVSVHQGQKVTPEQLLDDADVALYASKHKGRACHTFYHPSLRDQATPEAEAG